MPHSPVTAWFTPRLAALVAEAEAAGYQRDVSVAIITDVINGPLFSPGQATADDDWNRDLGEPEYMVNAAIGRDVTPEPQPGIGGALPESQVQVGDSKNV